MSQPDDDAESRQVEQVGSSELVAAYDAAFAEWAASGEAELWDVTVGDGLDELR